MLLYNTLTRSKEEFVPLSPGRVSLYCCGPTVYHYAHVGNLRSYVMEDVLRRAFSACGLKVLHVMNVTDVGHLTSDADEGEDKMEQGSRREGKTAWEIAEFYADAFFRDFSDLNCLMPGVVCKATGHIAEMIALVKTLEGKGFAYRAADGIYFDTEKFPDYHALAGKSHMDGIKAGARVALSEGKKNPSDFALWKFSPQTGRRQMEWDSPWGKGFPGWHIECSAMAMKYLGETLDVHCGGVDHIAVHHTNEIAQSEAATGKKFSRWWVHLEFLVSKDAEKMSKSSGEFLTLDSLRKKGFEPAAFRYFCLTAHYRTQLEFSWPAMEFAAKSLSTLRERASEAARLAGSAEKSAAADDVLKKFQSSVFDDLNVPAALASVWENLRGGGLSPGGQFYFLSEADKILGLNLFEERRETLDESLLSLIAEREAARNSRDFKKADELRSALEAKGILLKDTPQGTKWSKKQL